VSSDGAIPGDVRVAWRSRDPLGFLLAALGVAVLLITAAWIVRPFLVAAIWAAALVIVTWPAMLRLQAWLRGSRSAAITVTLVLLLLLVAVPLTLAVAAIVIHAGDLVGRMQAGLTVDVRTAPGWLSGLPIVGERIGTAWRDIAGMGGEAAWRRLAPYGTTLVGWLVGRIGNFGYQTVQFALTLVLAAFIYAHGEALAGGVARLTRRLWGAPGERLVQLTTPAIRGVALGVVLAAAIQSVLAGLGLAVAGVPFAGVLTAVLFLLCLAQVGMLVVLIPAVIWVFWSGDPLAATLLLGWSVAAAVLDQFLRPILVGRHAKLPALLIFVGVVGGLVAFGLLGIFVGPVVLAVAYELLSAWLRGDLTRSEPS
jgi:predicted PurR-regulated permease PerM